jgi:hypothetical protein
MPNVLDQMKQFSQTSLGIVQTAYRAGGKIAHWLQAKDDLQALYKEAFDLGFIHSSSEIKRVVSQVERCVLNPEREMNRLKAAGFCA